MKVTETFGKVTYKARKRLPCSVCGKTVVRQVTLWQTLSPFNRNTATGDVKTEPEILTELVLEAALWRELPVVHDRCLT